MRHLPHERVGTATVHVDAPLEVARQQCVAPRARGAGPGLTVENVRLATLALLVTPCELRARLGDHARHRVGVDPRRRRRWRVPLGSAFLPGETDDLVVVLVLVLVWTGHAEHCEQLLVRGPDGTKPRRRA